MINILIFRCVKPTDFDLDLSRYAGSWYEQHRYPVSFEPEAATCVRAQYTLQGIYTILTFLLISFRQRCAGQQLDDQ